MMNKKMIKLIGMLLCGNFMMVASQEDLLQKPSKEENKVQQALTLKFQGKDLTMEDNNIKNVDILKKKGAFLSQKSLLWPSWLAALSYTSKSANRLMEPESYSGHIIHPMGNFLFPRFDPAGERFHATIENPFASFSH